MAAALWKCIPGYPADAFLLPSPFIAQEQIWGALPQSPSSTTHPRHSNWPFSCPYKTRSNKPTWFCQLFRTSNSSCLSSWSEKEGIKPAGGFLVLPQKGLDRSPSPGKTHEGINTFKPSKDNSLVCEARKRDLLLALGTSSQVHVWLCPEAQSLQRFLEGPAVLLGRPHNQGRC